MFEIPKMFIKWSTLLLQCTYLGSQKVYKIEDYCCSAHVWDSKNVYKIEYSIVAVHMFGIPKMFTK